MATTDFMVLGTNDAALFSFKLYRGEGAALLAMDWKSGSPPLNFVGFAIEFQPPGQAEWFPLKNRVGFLGPDGKVNPAKLSTLESPIQKFRWVHFPHDANVQGQFTYRVKPAFMDGQGVLTFGDLQSAAIELGTETYPGQLNVAFTRGFVSSQAFAEAHKDINGELKTLMPEKADDGVAFVPTYPEADKAYEWMGFEARKAVLGLLDSAVADASAQVRMVVYDLNEPEVLARLKLLGNRLMVLLDDSGAHGEDGSAENQSEALLKAAGAQVKRQHMGNLQHNKTLVVKGDAVQAALCGSTNFSWRGWYIQSNNAVVVQGATAIQPWWDAFENYWSMQPAEFGNSISADWRDLGLNEIDAKISFSPHGSTKAKLQEIADDMRQTQSSLFYSLAFLSQTKGAIPDAILELTNRDGLFVYGISDKKSGAIVVQKPDGNPVPVYSAELSKHLPEPFRSEPSGGFGTRMHHKFVVIDFDQPTARVYFGSYNFSGAADRQNGENILCVRDKKVAVSYMIQALCMFDHYHFRVLMKEAKAAKVVISLRKPPASGLAKDAWWAPYFDPADAKMRDRQLFA